MRPILVTGGAGFIGSHLVARLLSQGESVVVIDDLSTGTIENLRPLAGDNLQVVVSKVSQCHDLDRYVANAKFVYHLAAAVGVDLVIAEPIRTIETNLKETEALFTAAGAHQTPVLLASTSEVYGKSQKTEFTEEDDLLIGPPTVGRWRYACSKLMDEFLAMAYAEQRKVPVIIIRIFNTVGPRQSGEYGMVIPRFIESAKRNQPLRVFGDGTQSRCFCYVGDTVTAILKLSATPAAFGEVFNIGSDQEITIRSLAEQIIQVLGSRSEIVYIPYDKAYAPGFEDLLRRRPRIEKLQQFTGFRPAVTLREIIQLTAGVV